ncbi:MAG TPA: CDP-alcohol phosphatidyltransferase family protein [Verrucomicrobiae bacterium]|jgi:CDP-diacylglycerol--glycerol-3-phosphate 3-phosphatidyltransferase
MTTANKITIVRILLVPLFLSQVLYYVETGSETYRLVAILSFVIASISDGVDGYLARHYNQHSELGRILDPLADKMLLVSAVVLLSFKNEPHLRAIPKFLTLAILSRDVLLLLGAAVIQHLCGKVLVRPVLLGKAATVLQMACVVWTLFKWPYNYLYYLAVAATVCTAISGLIYVYEGMRQLSASPSSSPSEKQ